MTDFASRWRISWQKLFVRVVGADVWSLGVVLYEMLAGLRPFA